MRIGRVASPHPVEQYFEESRQLGFGWLELGCSAPPNFPPTFDDQRIETVKRLGQQYGISYALHSASYVNTAEIMPTVRLAAEQHLLEYIRLAAKMEAEYLVIHCGFHFSQFMDTTYEALFKTFRAAVAEAERLKMPMMIENMNLLPPEAEIRYLGTTLEELKVVFDHLQSPYLGLALDVGHANLLPGGVPSFIEAFGPRIGGLHLHDNDGVIDRHWAMGKGTVDWPRVFSMLREVGYQGTYTIELREHDAVVASKAYLQSVGILAS